MNQTHSFLLEFGVEELPSQALLSMANALEKSFRLMLHEEQLNFKSLSVFATPRRLGLLIGQLDGQQKDETLVVRGPSIKAAFNAAGEAQGPAIGFASSCGVSVAELDRISSNKGEYLAFNQFKEGKNLVELVPGFIARAVKEMAINKTMRWGMSLHRFLRPIRWLTVLVDTEVVPCSIFNLESDRITYGHRIHHPAPISLTHAAEYEPRLQSQGYVIPNFITRRETIADQVNSIALSQNLVASPSAELLDEITGLVEWPVTLLGSFDEAFLKIPAECLISTMVQNQKYIPLLGRDGRLSYSFLFVANLESKSPDQVIQGNQRVIRPRFADAQFFYDADKRKPLMDLRPGLVRVIYQQELGSIFDKTERMAKLAELIAEQLQADKIAAITTAQLSKVDLLTAMVGEFPELQGTMGRYYAQAQGFSVEIAQALEEQYLPRGQGDALPNSKLGIVLSLTDKFDALVGLFAIGKEPSADRDPFALRRMALGIIRMCIELELDLDVLELAKAAFSFYQLSGNGIPENVAQFIMQRLPTLYRDSGIDMRIVRAVEALNIYNPFDFNKRLVVLNQFYSGVNASALAEVHKRVNNILKKNPVAGNISIQESMLTEAAEQALYKELRKIQPDLAIARATGNYAKLLELSASLRRDIDQFFIDVKVMSDNPAERENRLCLLIELRALFAEVGDLSYLA